MYRRLVATVAVSASFGLPTLAVAGIGAHSTWYDASVKNSAGVETGHVEIAYQRNKHVAEILGQLRCLGTIKKGVNKGQAAPFDDYPLYVRNNQIHFRGKTHNYPGSPNASAARKIRISLTLRPHVATGTIAFPGTKCGAIKIVGPAVRINP